MENIWVLIISAILIIASSLAGLIKKKTSEQKEEEREVSQYPPFSFYTKETSTNDEISSESFKDSKNEKISQKKYFSYDDLSMEDKEVSFIEEKNEIKAELVEEFDLKKAIIYSEIINKKYN